MRQGGHVEIQAEREDRGREGSGPRNWKQPSVNKKRSVEQADFPANQI